MFDTELDYQIVVPSRKRASNMSALTLKFPDSVIWVHEGEREDYLRVLPESRLRTHNVSGLAAIRREMILGTKNECVVMIDDDVDELYFLEGEKVTHTRDGAIMTQVIENSVRICKDLGLKMFGYNMIPEPKFYNSCNPMSLSTVFCFVYGVFGKNIVPDGRLHYILEDVDMVMTCLMDNRIVYKDCRFAFVGKSTGGGVGGCQGVRNSIDHEKDMEFMKKKWGKYLNIGKKRVSKKASNVNGLSLNVKRKSPLVVL